MTETLRFLIVIELVGLAGAALAGVVLARLPGAGLGFGKLFGLLLCGWLTWMLGSLGVPYGVPLAAGAGAVVLAAGLLVALRARARAQAGDVPEDGPLRRKLWRWSEGVFAVSFLGFALLSSFSPDVWGTEKPMDMMLVNGVNTSDSFPPQDPWIAGQDVNYYYLGHLLAAWMIKLTGVEPTAGYNLSIALFAALAVTAAFALTATAWAALGRAGAVRVGIAGAVLATLVGNLAAAQELLTDDVPLAAYDWFNTTRVVPDTINEFPYFSWVLGDLHAHVMAGPMSLLALAFGLQWLLRGPGSWLSLAAAALVLGWLYGMNSWSFPVIGGLLALSLALWARGRPEPEIRRAMLVGVLLLAGSVVAVLPFHVAFEPETANGFGWVSERRPFRAFAGELFLQIGLLLWILLAAYVGRLLATRKPARNLVWGLAVALLAGSVLAAENLVGAAILSGAVLVALIAAFSYELEDGQRWMWLLAAGGLACFLIPDLVYLRDPYDGGRFFRINTVFKLTYQGWYLLALAAAPALFLASSWLPRPMTVAWRIGVVVLGVASLAYPYAGTYARKGAFNDGPRLDGRGWLERSAPGDVAAIDWLREHAPRDAVVLEAAGDDYSAFGHARIATYTGRPTVIGWASHEAQWGNEPGNRRAEVQAAYTDASGNLARATLQRYGVDYVVVGPLERTDYGDAGVSKWDRLGRRVFERDGTIVWQV